MGIDLETYRQESRAAWAEMAPGWESRRDWMAQNTRAVTERLVELAGPEPGQRFLDVAAGAGHLGFEIAGRVGPQGRVISTDFSPEMVDVARRVGGELGLDNVDFMALDAEQMNLDADSVDGVVCRWGYMLMADAAAALSETRRVLRPGGALAFAVWASPDRNPWAAVPGMTLVQRGHAQPPDPGAPGMFALADPERIRSLVTAAGFGDPRVEEVSFSFRYRDYDDYWEALLELAGPLAGTIKDLDAAERDATREAIRESLEPHRNDDGSYTPPAVAWAVRTS